MEHLRNSRKRNINLSSGVGYLFILLVVLHVSYSNGQSSTGDVANGESSTGNTGITTDYYEDNSELEFDSHPPNVLVLLADPKNGTTMPLSHARNSDIVLQKELGKVHLFCSAYYPIQWIYRGDGFPFLNVDNTRFVEDFYDPTSYAFSALLELDGLLESQTGNYTCQKWDDETLASSFYVFVPGERILLLENNSSLSIDLNSTEITVPCSVSDPNATVVLKKFLPKGKDSSDWFPVANYLYQFSPKKGFTFSGTETPTGVGTFLCSTTTGTEAEVTMSVKDKFDKDKSDDPSDMCCDKKFLRSLGDERTSCRGYISHACQTPDYLTTLKSPCSDWKIADFLRNPVELCKEEISPQGASSGVGFYKAEDLSGQHLYVYCQADPKEFTQGFKIALQFQNGSILFIDDERHKVPVLSEFPSGYEVNAEISDIVTGPAQKISIHCYIPLKYSFKWIKISKDIPSSELASFDLNSINPAVGIDNNSLDGNGLPEAVTSLSTSLKSQTNVALLLPICVTLLAITRLLANGQN